MALMLSPRRSAITATAVAPVTAIAVQSRIRSAVRGMVRRIVSDFGRNRKRVAPEKTGARPLVGVRGGLRRTIEPGRQLSCDHQPKHAEITHERPPGMSPRRRPVPFHRQVAKPGKAVSD